MRTSGQVSGHRHDAVVIGAGPNGLVAANVLADAGWDVLVLEADSEPGGAVRSAADTPAPGYTADLFSAFYPLGIASPVLRGLRLEEHGLRWAHAPAAVAHVFDDGRAAVLSRDLERTASSVAAFAAEDGAAWRRWAGWWAEIEETLLDALLGPFPPVRHGLRLLTRLRATGSLHSARLAVLPVRRFCDEEFSGAGAGMLLAGNALHTDLSPESAGSALFGLLLAMVGQRHGFPVPVGGASGITDALVSRLGARGGTLRTGAPVVSVETDAAGACGVRLHDGERIAARRAVLADVPAPVLYRDLVGEESLTGAQQAALSRFQWDNATVKVNWAVAGKLPWVAPEVAGAGTVHMGGDLDDLTRYSASLATRTVPERPFVVLGQMTTADPSRSPEGTESVWAYAHLPNRAHAPEVINRFVDSIENEVERHAPGFRDLVVGRLVQDPLWLQKADGGLVGGALNGGTATIHQQLFLRPTTGLGRADTFVPGLFLAGSSAHPGGGVHGACGANAARAALARARSGRRLYDATVGRAQRHLA